MWEALGSILNTEKNQKTTTNKNPSLDELAPNPQRGSWDSAF
jgi:hypothetical protein